MAQELSMEEQINTSVDLPPTSAPVEPEVPATVGATNSVEVVVNIEENINADSGDDENVGAVVSVASGSGTEFTAKKKRGRPKKQVPEVAQPEEAAAAELSASPQKRGRGRPRGTGKWQTLAASFGCIAVGASGSNLTPHTMTIQAGENICQKIWSISQSQRASDSICVLSATGAVSVAEILQHGSMGGVVRYEGRFDIVTLTGSHLYSERGVERCRVTRLSVQLAYPDGRLFGGAVVGTLIAADPVQLVVATFKQNIREAPMVRQSPKPTKQRTDSAVASPVLATNGKPPVAEEITLTNAEHNSNQTTISPFSAPPPTDETEKVANDPDENRASSPLAVDENSSP